MDRTEGDDPGGTERDRDTGPDGRADDSSVDDFAADAADPADAAADGGSPEREAADHGGSTAADTADADDSPSSELPVSVDVEIEEGRSMIEVTGDRDAAVVVRSAAGERIYLPPEDFERPPESRGRGGGDARGTSGREGAYGTGPSPSDSPYQSTSDSPYQSPWRSDSPYQSAEESDSPYQRGGPVDERQGLEPTVDGFRIVHPEPITDMRVLR